MAKHRYLQKRGVLGIASRGIAFSLSLTAFISSLLPSFALGGVMPVPMAPSPSKTATNGLKYIESEQFDKAARVFSKYLNSPNKSEAALSYRGLGEVDAKVAKYAKGEAELTHALALQEKLYGPKDFHLVATLNNLSQLYAVTGRFLEAQKSIDRALAVNRGKDEVQQAETLDSQAKLLLLQGKIKAANEPAEKALNLRQQNLPMGDIKIVESLNTAASAALLQSKTQEAENQVRNALALTNDYNTRNSSARAESLDLLAKVYLDGSTPKSARPLAIQALEIRTKVFGPKHPIVGETYLTLGSINMELSAFKSAEDQFRSSLRIFQDLGNVRKREEVLSTCAIAFALAGQGKLADSESFWDQAMIMQNDIPGGALNGMDTLRAAYANILWQHDNWTEALSLGGGFSLLLSDEGANATIKSVVSGATKKPKWDILNGLDQNTVFLGIGLPLLCIIFLTIISTFSNGISFGVGRPLPRAGANRRGLGPPMPGSPGYWVNDAPRSAPRYRSQAEIESSLKKRFQRY